MLVIIEQIRDLLPHLVCWIQDISSLLYVAYLICQAVVIDQEENQELRFS